MKNKNGNIIKNREEIMEICAEYYQDLYNTVSPNENPRRNRTNREEVPPILEKEVENVIKNIKKGKAPGTDNITSDILKIGGTHTLKQLTKLYNLILLEKKIPEAWDVAKIILLFKKGERDEIKNYRPISLLSQLYKVFTKIIQKRIERILDENLPREQAGFRKSYYTQDH